MFNIKEIEKEAKEELGNEQAQNAKTKIKSKLKQIEQARKVVRNLEHEYDMLLEDIGE